MGRLFGTDGVRGIANDDLSPEVAFNLGRAGAAILVPKRKSRWPGKRGRIVVGKDTRISGDLLESALIAGICSAGVDVLKLGVLPTPGIAYLTKTLEADAGVAISASHNPAEYNGIKFFNDRGFKLSDEMEDKVEATIELPQNQSFIGGNVGTLMDAQHTTEYYINHVINTISGGLDNFTVALDCANGAAYEVSPSVFEKLGAKVLGFAVEPDGLNINLHCGSTHPQYVQEIVGSHSVDLGLAHDGDADRVIVVDEDGEMVDGDFIMAVCALDLKNRGLLTNNRVVTTVMTNVGFDLSMEKHGIEVIKTPVGDRYVLREMLRTGAVLGGEQSGHIIFLKHNTTGDGIITALQLMDIMRREESSLSKLKKVMERFPQVLVNVEVKDKNRLGEANRVWEIIKKVEGSLKGRGRILVRPSGTESLVRVMIESDDQHRAKEIAHQIAEVVEEELN